MKRHVAALLLSLLFLNLALPASGVRCARASIGEAGPTAPTTDHTAHGGHQISMALLAGETAGIAQEAPVDHQQLPTHCSAGMACSMFALPDAGTELVAATAGTGDRNWAPAGILHSIGTAPELPPPRA